MTTEATGGRQRRRVGGGKRRRSERTTLNTETAKYIERNVPILDILSTEALELIEYNAETILEEIGFDFVDNPDGIALWKNAGADTDGERVRLPRGLAKSLISTAPTFFTQHARNPEKSVLISPETIVFAPVYGPPFVYTLEGERRYGTIEDFRNFIKLGYMSKWLHHSGGTVCEPTDLPVNKRHLDMVYSHIKFSDKPFMGSVTESTRAEDTVEMAKIVFGKEFVENNTVLTSLINVNSPLTFDSLMMNSLEVYSQNNQAVILSPFIVGGAMSPVSIIGTLTQVMAEVFVGISYTQLVRKGSPVIFGTFVTSIDMNSGAPTFGTPEATKIIYGAGQLARKLNLPFRSGGGLCGSKLPDAQAGYESSASLQASLFGGVNFMLHSCGWLEGGLVSSFEKFIMDADQLGSLHQLASKIDISENGQALDAIREVQPGGHYLGCQHTQSNFKTAFWKSDVLDYNPYETWLEKGAEDTQTLAKKRVKKLLDEYQIPFLDPSIDEALKEFMDKKKSLFPDSFI